MNSGSAATFGESMSGLWNRSVNGQVWALRLSKLPRSSITPHSSLITIWRERGREQDRQAKSCVTKSSGGSQTMMHTKNSSVPLMASLLSPSHEALIHKWRGDFNCAVP
jgi:hypothetical protein